MFLFAYLAYFLINLKLVLNKTLSLFGCLKIYTVNKVTLLCIYVHFVELDHVTKNVGLSFAGISNETLLLAGYSRNYNNKKHKAENFFRHKKNAKKVK